MAKIEARCVNCNKKFITYHSEIKLFCSLGCQFEDSSRWYFCPHCDAGYVNQKCICNEKFLKFKESEE